MNGKTWLFGTDRRCLLLIIPLAAVLFSFDLGGRDLWAPDEPDTGEVVREILLNGRFGALTDNDVPFLEKPPLYHWMAALFALPSGRVTSFTLRLPSSLAALAGVILLFFLGRDLFGRRTGALAAIVLMTSQKYFFEARWAHVDMLWSVLLLAAALCFHRASRRAWHPGWLAGMYAAMGLAVITKGPLGLLLPALAIAVFLAAGRDLAAVRRLGLVWGVPLALVPAAAGLLAWASSGTPYPLHATLERLLRRFTSGVHHREPFWATFANLAVIFLPWTLLLPSAVARTIPRPKARPDRENVYVYSWLIVILTVFALSVEKRAVYLLPMLPFLSLLIARLWDTALFDWDPPATGRAVVRFLWIVAGSLVVFGAGAVAFLPRIRRAAADVPGAVDDLLPAGIVLLAVALVAVAAAIATRRRHGDGIALGVFSAGLAAFYLVAAGMAMPRLDPYKSAREFSVRAARTAGAAPLAMYPDYRPAYVFYGERFIEVLTSRDRLRAYLASPTPVYLLIEEGNYAAETRGDGPPMRILDRESIGHRATLLVTNAPAGDRPRGSPADGSPGAASDRTPELR